MRFFLDMNISPRIADRLRREGHDAIHAMDAGYGDLPDQDVFERASGDGRIVISNDLDFGDVARSSGISGCGVVLLRLRSVRSSHLWDRLQFAIAEAGDALEAGAIVLVEDARLRVRRLAE
jgi:predicted nuclease of predicted toxin-antitoxin system